MDVLSRAVMCFCLMGWMTLGWSNAATYTSNTLKSNIDKLKNTYKISKDQLFNGKPVFPKDTFEDSERRVLMSAVLDVYLSIFSQMLNQTVDQEVMERLVQVKGKVQELQKHYFLGRIPELRRHLQNLWAIKTSDTRVQGKALSEFIPIYEKASQLANRIHLKKDNRRKRRQAQRLKSHIM
ncbi:interferon gamma 1-like [Coregonus clupeaformis]|uniref:interferon gamma 1-like n=1 Tax=Coregonus clupeaformis TaxID=59861 RepID=UPI001BE0D19B|nr:interferon gamma 1-like [Coregonus clupeaformis]